MSDLPQTPEAAAEWIRAQYQRLASTPSDIYQHMHTLRELASTRHKILELGTRHGVSTVGFLAGLLEKKERNPLGGLPTIPCIWTMDIDQKPEIEVIADVAERCELGVIYLDHDTSTPFRRKSPSQVDLLFIDTWHVEQQLKAELNWAPRRVKPGGLMVLHDTITFWDDGETKGHRGLRYALEPWLALEENEDWYIVRHDAYNNGLLILERRNEAV